jgi:hypothetical protein
MKLAAMLAVLAGCLDIAATSEARLMPFPEDSEGPLYYDGELDEECRPRATELHGTRCLPRFTAVPAESLGYRDAECTELIAWSDIERSEDRYVAVVSYGGRVASVFRVLQRHEVDPKTVRKVPLYRLAAGRCAAVREEVDHTYLDISTAMHPEQFASLDE